MRGPDPRKAAVASSRRRRQSAAPFLPEPDPHELCGSGEDSADLFASDGRVSAAAFGERPSPFQPARQATR